ncbi:MAG: TraB/GumN family protein [Treponema sp.]|nr:TraB/GumN family protein [Treponema sp.]
MKKRLLVIALLFVTVFSVFAKDKATVTKKEGAMFWEISGTDKKGQPSKVYILGTFHAGDESLYPLPAYVMEAFENADVVSGEISTEGWSQINDLIQAQVMKAIISDPKKTLDNYLTDDEKRILKENLGAQAAAYYSFKPWVLNQVLSSLVLNEVDLDFVEAYDNYFINLCNSTGRHMEGLDDVKVQVDIITYGNFDYQLAALKQNIAALEDPDETVENFMKLYNAYLSKDDKVMEEAYFAELKAEAASNSDMKGYYNALLKNRNKTWAKKIAKYISNGGTTFIFAGTGHFIGEDSVFNMMRANKTLQ